MEEQNKEQKIVQLFIKIILYLLLAFAFFSVYYVEVDKIRTGVIVIFLSAIISLIALAVIYCINFKNKIYLTVVSTLPFLLMISFNLIFLYYDALTISYNGWGFFTKIPELFGKMMNAESIVITLEVLFILIVGWVGFILGIHYKNKKRN